MSPQRVDEHFHNLNFVTREDEDKIMVDFFIYGIAYTIESNGAYKHIPFEEGINLEVEKRRIGLE